MLLLALGVTCACRQAGCRPPSCMGRASSHATHLRKYQLEGMPPHPRTLDILDCSKASMLTLLISRAYHGRVAKQPLAAILSALRSDRGQLHLRHTATRTLQHP